MQRLRRSRSTTSPCPLIRSVTRETAVRFPQKSPARACAHTSRRTCAAGTHHSFYRDSDITITAVPNAGYRVQDWTINGQTTADTAASKTLYNLQDETTVQVRFVKLVTGITFGPTDENKRRRLYQRGRGE